MLRDIIEVKLTKQEVATIITALRNVPYSKCTCDTRDLIDKLKGKDNEPEFLRKERDCICARNTLSTKDLAYHLGFNNLSD